MVGQKYVVLCVRGYVLDDGELRSTPFSSLPVSFNVFLGGQYT